MKKFNILSEIQELIQSKQIVEFDLNGIEYLVYAYPLQANSEYITLGVVSPAGTLTGVTICRFEDVRLFSTKTIYIGEMTKLVEGESVRQQALKEIEDIEEFTFVGVASYLQQSKIVAQISIDHDETFDARIVGFDDAFMVCDEFMGGKDKRLARTYFPISSICRIVLSTPMLKATNQYLIENNIE